jgi:hypothetical protein
MFSIGSNKCMKELLDGLVKKSIIKSEKVYNAMIQVDRADFIDKRIAYEDR